MNTATFCISLPSSAGIESRAAPTSSPNRSGSTSMNALTELAGDGAGRSKGAAVGAGGRPVPGWSSGGLCDHVAQQLLERDHGIDPQVLPERPGNGVDLVDEEFAVVIEEVEPGHAAQSGQVGDGGGGLTQLLLDLAGDLGGQLLGRCHHAFAAQVF